MGTTKEGYEYDYEGLSVEEYRRVLKDARQPPAPIPMPQSDEQILSTKQWREPGVRAKYAENAQDLWIKIYTNECIQPRNRLARADEAVKAFRERFDMDYAAQISETETIWVKE